MILTPSQLNRRAELYHQLGAMITAGVPLLQALQMVSANPAARASRQTILGLIRHLQSGLTFGESMMRVQGWMPDFDKALLEVGEKSGRLDVGFKQLAAYYGARAQIFRETIAGLLTTLATLHVFLLVFPLGLMVGFVQGILAGDYSRCVPFLIEKAIVFGGGYGAVLFLVYASQGNRGEHWRSLVEMLARRIPILGTARWYLVLSRLASSLEALINAGVSIVQGWELASATCGSPALRRTVAGWKARFDAGATPAELVNASGHFPDMFANLYHTAEQSGQLDETLRRLHAYYLEEGFRKMRFFSRVLNGVVYGVVVLLVALNIIGFYANYFGAALQATEGL